MPDDIIISADPELLDRDWIVRAVQGSYWGGGFTVPQILAALDESCVWGAYAHFGQLQVGFVRAVTDTAIWSSVTDVFVDGAFRGKGIGSALMDAVVADERIKHTLCILQARPAAQLWYLKWGFRLVDPVHGIMQRNPVLA